MGNCEECDKYDECNYAGRYDYAYDGIIDYKTNKKYKSYGEIVDVLNEKEEFFNGCENCYYFNELIDWNDGLFYQCLKGNKLWVKCDDYEVLE